MSDNTLHSSYSDEPHTHLISALVKGDIVPAPIWQKPDYRLKFLLRTFLYYPATRRMLDYLGKRDDFETLLNAQATLPSKAHRQYLSRELSSARRADAIISHYQFVDTLSSPLLARAFTSADWLPVLTFSGKDESRFTLYASCASNAEREGESTLWLCDENKTLLASTTFSVTRQGEKLALVIGGLQGPRRDVGPEAIKLATRACYGLFPKRILVEFLGLFAAQCGITSLCGVSDNGHVFRALRYRFSKARHFHASYDEFWSSIDGVKRSPYLWALPLKQERKTIESVPSKKRAEYRRRFALLDEMAEQFAILFSSR